MKKLLLSLATVLCASAFASAGEVTDVLNNDNLVGGATTVYGEHTYTAESGATYYAQCAGENNSIQLRSKNSNSGVIVTNSVGTVKSITITFNTKTAASREVNVYGSDAPFTNNNATGLYNGPTPVTTFVYDGTTQTYTYTFETEYAYIGFRSKSGALYLDKVDIVWNVTGKTVEAPKFSLEPGIFTDAQTVTITAAEGTDIYYTTDGKNPTVDVNDGSTIKYTEPITISTTTTLNAIAVDADGNKSGVATATYFILLEGAEGEGTEANPFNVAAAHDAANQGSTATVYVKGYITNIKEVSTQFGNATYSINDDTTYDEASALVIFRGYYGNNIKFTAEDQIAKGNLVVVYGKLTDYNGTKELTNSYIVTLDGNTTGVEAIENDANAPVEYFNLQGVRVDNPAKGLYIMRQGSKVVKVVK